MLGLAYLILAIASGVHWTRRLFAMALLDTLAFGSLLGILLTTWISYLAACGAAYLGSSYPIEIGAATAAAICISGLLWSRYRSHSLTNVLSYPTRFELAFALVSLFISAALMFSTFGYDSEKGFFLVDRLIHSDFASHIPLIRSFSLGENIPPEAPLMAGERIRYHFFFHFFTGLLENLGLRMDWALNLLSTLGFFALLISIRKLSLVLFAGKKARWIGLAAVFLFLTSSSLAFLQGNYFPHTWSQIFRELFERREFLSGGPYYRWDQQITGLFWTLTIYTNQRHFAFGIALVIFIWALILEKSEQNLRPAFPVFVVLGVIAGLIPFFHGLSFTALMIVLGCYGLLAKHKIPLLVFGIVASCVALPQFAYLSPTNPDAAPQWYLGYGAHQNLSISSFLTFWWKNLGLKFPLIVLAPILLRGPARKLFLSGLAVFIVPNLMKFGPDVWTSHKFFNIWIILLNLAAAYVCIWLFFRRWPFKILSGVLLISFSISGIMDLSPIFRDHAFPVHDRKADTLVQFVIGETDPKATFATSYRIYDPITVTGRKVLLGWPYFVWSAGYDAQARERKVRHIFEASSNRERCDLIDELRVDYLVAAKKEALNEPYKPDLSLLRSEFDVTFENSTHVIFDAESGCSNR